MYKLLSINDLKSILLQVPADRKNKAKIIVDLIEKLDIPIYAFTITVKNQSKVLLNVKGTSLIIDMFNHTPQELMEVDAPVFQLPHRHPGVYEFYSVIDPICDKYDIPAYRSYVGLNGFLDSNGLLDNDSHFLKYLLEFYCHICFTEAKVLNGTISTCTNYAVKNIRNSNQLMANDIVGFYDLKESFSEKWDFVCKSSFFQYPIMSNNPYITNKMFVYDNNFVVKDDDKLKEPYGLTQDELIRVINAKNCSTVAIFNIICVKAESNTLADIDWDCQFMGICRLNKVQSALERRVVWDIVDKIFTTNN